MSFYTIPPSLVSEFESLGSSIANFQAGTLDAEAFKAKRVPFGIYEQRNDGTYMVRVRCPGGAITPRQLRAIAELSQEYAADQLHITTRQELQLHDVALDDLVPILRRLFDAGLSTRGGGGNTVRNITASHDSGVAPDETFDPSPYVFALTSRLTAEADSWGLPRKYKIAFSNSPRDTARACFQDLGFIAIEKDGNLGFAVYVAGGLGAKSQVGHLLHEFIFPNDAYLVAEAIKRLFHKYGNRTNRHAARLRFLWNSLGEEQFRLSYEQECEELRRKDAEPLALPLPLANQPSPAAAINRADSPDFGTWRRRYVSEQKQARLYTVIVPIEFGNLPNTHAIALADFLDPLGTDSLRATIDQNLALRNIPEATLPELHQRVKNISPLSSSPRLLGCTVACTGAGTCKLGICLSRGALSATLRQLQQSNLDLDGLSEMRIQISGCPNNCGAHAIADLGFFGRVARSGDRPYPAYEVVVGGSLGLGNSRLAEPIGTVAARDLPSAVVEILQQCLHHQGESVGFREYLAGRGKTDLQLLCQKYRNVPPFDEDKNYYIDWDATEVFTRGNRAAAEPSGVPPTAPVTKSPITKLP